MVTAPVTPQVRRSRARKSPSSLANDLDAKAAAALDEAEKMSPGDGRIEAANRAAVFRNAASLHELLCGKRDASKA
jgi:hypothetical protein